MNKVEYYACRCGRTVKIRVDGRIPRHRAAPVGDYRRKVWPCSMSYERVPGQ